MLRRTGEVRGAMRFYNIEAEYDRYRNERQRMPRNRLPLPPPRDGGCSRNGASDYIGRIGHSGISLLRSAGIRLNPVGSAVRLVH